MAEFRIFHVARNAARHNSELDDQLYGTPEPKENIDWAVRCPEEVKRYLQNIKGELNALDTAISDLAYLFQEKGEPQTYEENPVLPSLEEADAYVFHAFTVRQFKYSEDLSHLLKSNSPNDIKFDFSKARRQFNVLLSAREDLLVTQVRFTQYYKILCSKLNK